MRILTKVNGETPTPETNTTLSSSIETREDSNTVGAERTVAETITLIESDIAYNQSKLTELQTYNALEGQDATESIEKLNEAIYKQQQWLITLNSLDANLPVPEGTQFFKY